jgi:bifunctional non-homologous end joining protein LigD
MSTEKSASLYFKEGTSDKVYNATVEDVDGGYVVNFAYGRRGNSLTTGTKTTSPVSLDAATKIFDKLLKEKTGKGYQFVKDGGQSIPTVTPTDTPTPSKCVLLNPIDAETADRMLDGKDWSMQEKVDGVRFMLESKGGKLRGYNRRGAEVAVPNDVRDQLKDVEGDFTIDGELVGDVLHCFDLVDAGKGFSERFRELCALLPVKLGSGVRVVSTAVNRDDKRWLYNSVVEMKGEGVVFKRKDAMYVVGRPSSGGDYLKFKFCETASCQVVNVNDKRSVGIALKSDVGLVPAGNVTIPPNHDVPTVGSVVEVRYLYAFEPATLYQPVYLGVRNDCEVDDARSVKLKAV